MASTKVEMVSLLKEKQKTAKKRSHNLAYVITRAQAGKYHCWESDLDTPKVQLVADLKAVRHIDVDDVIQLVIDGEFDEEPTEAQLEELRASVGPEMYDKMFPEDAKKRGQA